MTGIKGTVKVKVTSPIGVVDEVEMDTADDGTFVVQFLAEMEGMYDILVDFAGQSPYLPSSASISISVKPVPIPTNISLVGPSEEVQVGMVVNVGGTLGF